MHWKGSFLRTLHILSRVWREQDLESWIHLTSIAWGLEDKVQKDTSLSKSELNKGKLKTSSLVQCYNSLVTPDLYHVRPCHAMSCSQPAIPRYLLLGAGGTHGAESKVSTKEYRWSGATDGFHICHRSVSQSQNLTKKGMWQTSHQHVSEPEKHPAALPCLYPPFPSHLSPWAGALHIPFFLFSTANCLANLAMAVFHLGPGALPPLGPPGTAVRWPPVLAENSTRLDTSRPGPAFGISCHPEFDLSFPKKSIKLLNKKPSELWIPGWKTAADLPPWLCKSWASALKSRLLLLGSLRDTWWSVWSWRCDGQSWQNEVPEKPIRIESYWGIDLMHQPRAIWTIPIYFNPGLHVYLFLSIYLSIYIYILYIYIYS